MKLYLHTPYYKNSDFMAHLCEHLVLHPNTTDIEQYLNHYYDSEGSLSGEYTSLKFKGNSDYKMHIHTAFSPLITRKVVDYEMDIFAEEFGEVSYYLRLMDKLRKQSYGKSYSSQPKKYSLKEIGDYHDTWYSNGSRVARDEDTARVIDHNIQDLKPITAINLPAYIYQELLLEGLKNHIWVCTHTSITDVVITGIIDDIFTTWDAYQKRYRLGSYYTQGPTTSFDDSYCVLRFSAHTRYNITPEFITAYKTKVRSLIKSESYRSSRIPIGMICKKEQLTMDNIIQALDLINYDYLKHMIEQIDL